MHRFLFNPRWLGLLAFVLVFGAVCFQLGMWQFHRLQDRFDRNDVISAHLAADPVDLDVAAPPGTTIDESTEWTRVTLRGSYDPDRAASVKFTQRDSAPGVDVVVPLRLDDGTAILVDRGWMQTLNSNDRPDLPAPPDGEVTVQGWLRQDNNAGGDAVRVFDGQVRAIDSTGFAESVPYDLRDGYVNAQEESPAPATELAPEPEPELGQGVHFFYALQWWFFGLLGLVGYVWFAVQEARDRRRRSLSTAAAPAPDEPASAQDHART